MKKLSNSDMIGKAGISLVGLRLAEIGFLFHETGSVEAGTDGFVEIRDPATGAMLSAVFRLQSKATKDGRAWQRETEGSFEFPCKERDISDWVASNVPVVLVCSDVSRQIAFWKDVTSYFRTPRTGEPAVSSSTRPPTPSTEAPARCLLRGDARRPPGVYIPPHPKKEQLLSNLLPVIEYPKHVWVAPALVTHMWEVEEILRAAGIGVECFVRAGRLFSFRSLEEREWPEVCEVESAERFDSSEWAESDDRAKQHEFAELLRRALGEKVRERIEYDRGRSSSTSVLPTISPRCGCQPAGACFGCTTSETAGSATTAISGSTDDSSGSTALGISRSLPQYRFTRDGFAVSKFQAENISGIKRKEHNDAVRQQVQALAAFLNQQATLLTPEYRYLAFGDPLRFEVDFGFDEGAWRARDQEGGSDMQLFDVA